MFTWSCNYNAQTQNDMRIMSVCACGLHSLNFLRLIYHEWLQRKIILKTSAGGAECVLVPHLGGDGITCTSWSDANLGIPPGAMIKQYMGVAPSIVTMVHTPHHLSLQFKPTSGFQFLHPIAFLSDKKKVIHKSGKSFFQRSSPEQHRCCQ